MAVGLAVLTFIRSSVFHRVSWSFAAHAAIEMGLPYDGAEFADAYSAEWFKQEKASALRHLAPDLIPGRGEISERRMKQFTKYHVFGWVDVWDEQKNTTIPLPTHIYTDRVMTIAEYNEELLRLWEEREREWGVTGPSGRFLYVRARVDMIEHNTDWAW